MAAATSSGSTVATGSIHLGIEDPAYSASAGQPVTPASDAMLIIITLAKRFFRRICVRLSFRYLGTDGTRDRFVDAKDKSCNLLHVYRVAHHRGEGFSDKRFDLLARQRSIRSHAVPEFVALRLWRTSQITRSTSTRQQRRTVLPRTA
jgi:hypothetical protein